MTCCEYRWNLSPYPSWVSIQCCHLLQSRCTNLQGVMMPNTMFHTVCVSDCQIGVSLNCVLGSRSLTWMEGGWIHESSITNQGKPDPVSPVRIHAREKWGLIQIQGTSTDPNTKAVSSMMLHKSISGKEQQFSYTSQFTLSVSLSLSQNHILIFKCILVQTLLSHQLHAHIVFTPKTLDFVLVIIFTVYN